jgi:monoamine oxidase
LKHKCILFYLQDEVGGRILSAPFGQGSVELGAQWLVGATSNPLSNLATVYKAPRAEFISSLNRGFAGGDSDDAAIAGSSTAYPSSVLASKFWKKLMTIKNGTSYESLETSVQQVVDSVQSNKASKENLTFANQLSSPLTRQSIAGAPLNDLSAVFYAEDAELTGFSTISLGNFSLIPSGVASRINRTMVSAVILSAPVTSISIADFNATVQIQNGTAYSAQYVVSTAPLGVLKENLINFLPPLPNVTLGAISRLGVGTVNPVHLLFNTPFWESSAETLTISQSTAGGWVDFVSMYTFSGEAVLVALPGADASAWIEQELDDTVVAAAAMDALRKRYGDKVPSNPIASIVTRWGLNPYARGSHSYYAVGSTPGDRSTLAEPVGGTLLLAGEAFHAVHPSSLHGAYYSGMDQAARIVAAMQFPEEDGMCMQQCYG